MKQTPVSMRAPCTKCDKLIANGMGSPLSGIFVCYDCAKADPKIWRRLTPEAKKYLKKPTGGAE